MAISARTLALQSDRRAALEEMADAQVLALTRGWVEAWDALEPEFLLSMQASMADARAGRLTAGQVARNRRLLRALEQAQARLEELAELTRTTIAADLPAAVLSGASGQIDLLQSQLPPLDQRNVLPAFTTVPQATLDAIVARTLEQVTVLTYPLSEEATRVMKDALVRGVATGQNPMKTARQMVRDAEQGFNGGLNRAMTIARTETLDAHRAAGQATDVENLAVTSGWEWHAQLDARTCIGCLSRHGQRYEVEETGPDGHQNCRCARIPRTRTWRELGFNIDEPPSETVDAEGWFAGLTEDTQRDIMGPARLRLYQEGKVEWSNLSSVRKNEAWRDSVVPTPVRDLQKAGT